MTKKRGSRRGAGGAAVRTDAGARAPKPSEAAPVLQAAEEQPKRDLVELAIAGGLGLVVMARPVWDGSVYENANLWFLYAVYGLFAAWGVYQLLSGGTLRFGRHLGFFAAFLAMAALSAVGTFQVDLTYRALLAWLGYFLLFLLASNALRSRLSIGIVLGCFVVAVFGEALFSWFHYRYILPFLRMRLIQSPSLLASQFGTDTLTFELAHRLNANRAFGSFLFANALAAFLVLAIPYVVGELANSVFRFRQLPRELNTDEPGASPYKGKRALAVVIGLALWAVSLMVAWVAYPSLFLIVMQRPDWMTDLGPVILYMGVLPIVIGVIPGVFIGVYGLRKGWFGYQALVLAVTAVAALGILWLTFSRGGFLALLGASVAGVLLAWWSGNGQVRWRREPARAALAGLGLLLAATAALSGMSNAAAQAAPPAPAAAPAAPAAAPAAPPADPYAPKLIVEGTELKVSDLANVATFKMRLAYWRVGLRMAKNNLLTGVGLGTFSIAYSQYQDLEAPPVKAAHNDYVQILSETGILGFLAFAGFWGFFLAWGLKRIPEITDRGTRWALVGLYAGILAFLLHSVVDFNFYNPSLAMLEFALAGVFLARAGTGAAAVTSAPRVAHQAVLVGLLALTALAAASVVRVQVTAERVGDDPSVNARFNAATTLAGLDPQQYRPDMPLRLPYADVARLVPDRETIESFGNIYLYVPGPQPTYRPLEAGKPVAAGELDQALVLIRDPGRARQAALDGARERMAVLERAHALFPHDPQVPAELFRWSDFMRQRVQNPVQEREHITGMVKWSEEAVRRGPHGAALRGYYGNSLLRRGMVANNGQETLDYYRKAVAEYRKSTELWPTSDAVWHEYANVLGRVAEVLEKQKLDEAKLYRQEEQRARQEVARIQRLKG